MSTELVGSAISKMMDEHGQADTPIFVPVQFLSLVMCDFLQYFITKTQSNSRLRTNNNGIKIYQ